MHRLAVATTFALLATVLPGYAGPMLIEKPNNGYETILVGDREKAAIGGAIVGGALGVMLGAAANRNAAPPPPAYARPTPPPRWKRWTSPSP
jgi:hypothetical protein